MNNIVSNLDNTMTKLSVNSLNYVKKLSNPNLSVLREM